MKLIFTIALGLSCLVSFAAAQSPSQIPGYVGADSSSYTSYGSTYTDTDYIYAYGSIAGFQSAFSNSGSFTRIDTSEYNTADFAEDLAELREQGFGDLVDAFLAGSDGISVFYYEFGDSSYGNETEYLVFIIPGFGALSPIEQRLVNSSEQAVLAPVPQQTTQRTSSVLRARALGRLGGIHAGVEPAVMTEGGNSIHFEYNYIDTSLDNAGVGVAGETNVYSIGYEHYIGGGLFLDFSYEYGNQALVNGAIGVGNDTHTVAASLSKDLGSNLYGFLVSGGSWSDGSTNLGGVELLGTTGSIFFINPGLGTSWVFGDFVVDHSLSYLYQNGSTRSTVNGIRVAGGAETGQMVADLGVRYNLTDSLYARVGLQYNNILDENFGAGVLLDKNWVQINTEVGAMIGASTNVYVGHSYDAGHSIYNTHTYRAGFVYGF